MKKILNLVLIIFIITALAGFSFACGAQESAGEESQAAEEQAEETTAAAEDTTAAEETKDETVAQAAGECPAATSVQLESTNGAYSDRMPISWDSIGAQQAYLSHSTNNTGLFIYIANFETTENLKDVALSEGQAVLQFTVTVVGEGDPVPVSVGTYNVKEWVDNYVSAGIRLTGGTTVSLSNSSIDTAEFEITSVSDTEICGKFSITEKWTKMSGEFKVPVMK
ncbi:MAG: hypothetical protein JW997_03210 [Actinobacteria bacterium]|nr:hypothetical protein [Actinomycetota bacterium]